MGSISSKLTNPLAPHRNHTSALLEAIYLFLTSLTSYIPIPHSLRFSPEPQNHSDAIHYLRSSISLALPVLSLSLARFREETHGAQWYITSATRDALWRARILYPTRPPYISDISPVEAQATKGLRSACNSLAVSLNRAAGMQGELGKDVASALRFLNRVEGGPRHVAILIGKLEELRRVTGEGDLMEKEKETEGVEVVDGGKECLLFVQEGD